MNDTLDSLLGKIRQLEKELVEEGKKKEKEFCYSIHAKKVRFTEAAKTAHLRLRLGIPSYILHSRFFVLTTAPVIWLCVIPIALADLIGSIY
jgi:hypothetical protein